MDKGVVDEDVCVLCNEGRGTRAHLFLECSFSVEVWKGILVAVNIGCNRRSWFSWDSWKEWFIKVTRGKTAKAAGRRGLLVATMYELWRERNNRIFNQGLRVFGFWLRKVLWRYGARRVFAGMYGAYGSWFLDELCGSCIVCIRLLCFVLSRVYFLLMPGMYRS
ncbi:hypothetical protein Dimus_014071 [Dionaea muscipula]